MCCRTRSAGLAVVGLSVAAGAVLRQFEPVGVVAPVLLGDVVALLAHVAGKGDLGANVCGLGGHCSSSRRASARCWAADVLRSEEHTSELQSRGHLVCRLLLEKKK